MRDNVSSQGDNAIAQEGLDIAIPIIYSIYIRIRTNLRFSFIINSL